MASGLRNDSLGLWYDAKSAVAQSISDLKSSVFQCKSKLEEEYHNSNPMFNSRHNASNGDSRSVNSASPEQKH